MEIYLVILVLITICMSLINYRISLIRNDFEKYKSDVELKEWQTELNKKIYKANIYKVEPETEKETKTFDLTFEDGRVETYNIDNEQTNT